MQLEQNNQLLFIGDSITDCGRKRPIGEGGFDQALGNGYVSLVNAAITAIYPDFAIKVINMGVSGNTVLDLDSRWKRDVLALNPDWLSILIGINDVWWLFNQGWRPGNQPNINDYTQTLDALIHQVRPNLHGLILMTPYYLEPDFNDPLRMMMDRYGEVVKELASKHNAILVDSQAYFDRVLNWMDPFDLAPDRVHINLTGHMILTRAFLSSIEFSWERNWE
jgi:lysophospholipase L1-like esterase